ncbi:hypothetical protein [Demequina aestuarii]|uniref:hypothetical protein n=1 Tax=Demequina aestuarii TaxID=327095 RepID=UPI000783E705|nr:hypothetical protein [Demequina aestuarii]
METVDVVGGRERSGARPRSLRGWHVPWRVLGTIAVAVAVLVGIDQFSTSEPVVQAEPAPEVRSGTVLTDEQQTFLLFHEWTDEQQVAACMEERGLPYEADPQREAGRADRVASLLDIAPTPTGAHIASATMRNAHVLALLEPAGQESWRAALAAKSSAGGCASPSHLVYIDNTRAVSEAVEAARTDTDFRAYVAEVLHLRDDPVRAVQSAALVGSGQPEPAADGQWDTELARVNELLGASMVWIPQDPVRAASHADVAGLAGDGTALLVRVAREGEPRIVSATAGVMPDLITCAGQQIEIAAWPSWAASRGGVDGPAAIAHQAITEGFC